MPLVSERIEIVASIHAAFAVNKDESLQLGIAVRLRDSDDGRANVIYYASRKFKRVCKSVLAAEVFELVDGFDIDVSIQDFLKTITGRLGIPLVLYTDYQSLYGLCISLSSTTERLLQIDLAKIFEAYETPAISRILWISSPSSPADDLTKVDKRNGTLAGILRTNIFNRTSLAEIERDNNRDVPVTSPFTRRYCKRWNVFQRRSRGCVTRVHPTAAF